MIFGCMGISRFRSYYTLAYVLIAAFIAMQWTTTHIHLSEQHGHDSGIHQHQLDTHAHQLSAQHVSTVENSDVASHEDVKELDFESTLLKKDNKWKYLPIVLYQSPLNIIVSGINIPIDDHVIHDHLRQAPFNPRAPPKYIS